MKRNTNTKSLQIMAQEDQYGPWVCVIHGIELQLLVLVCVFAPCYCMAFIIMAISAKFAPCGARQKISTPAPLSEKGLRHAAGEQKYGWNLENIMEI